MKKFLKLGCLAGLLLVFTVGFIYAVWHQEVSQVNHLVADTIEAKMVENYTPSEPVGTVTKEVSFQNNGTTDVFLRVAKVETWTKKDEDNQEEILSNTLADKTEVATKNWTSAWTNQWQDGNDGWFYYKYVLGPGETTDKILSSVTFPDTEQEAYQAYADADYALYFKVEMLQASTGDATLNKDDVNEKASTDVFGKQATVNQSTGNVTWN